METRTLVNVGSVSLAKAAYAGLVDHCREHKLDAKNMFLYYQEGDLHVGFSSDESTHITLNHIHWMPRHLA